MYVVQMRNSLYHIIIITYKAHIPNIHALNSDTHTLFLGTVFSILILNSQCVGVDICSIEGIDIWYIIYRIWALSSKFIDLKS